MVSLFLALLVLGSGLGILVGFGMVLSKATRKQGQKVLLYSLIGLVVGFGGCALFPLDLR